MAKGVVASDGIERPRPWRTKRQRLAAGGLGAILLLVGVVAAATDGFGSFHSALLSPERAPTQATPGDVSVRSLSDALLAQAGPPRPTAVSCHVASGAQRARSPFGPSALPLFTCGLTVSGLRSNYLVQVLHNGCFVAERIPVGRAVYGCGVVRT